jgi:hypothetical protein
MKTMKQLTLVDKINRLIPEAKAIESEAFGWPEGGIYFRGSEDYVEATGVPIFDYWNPGETFGVNPVLNQILEDAGWFAEPNDPGTLLAWN